MTGMIADKSKLSFTNFNNRELTEEEKAKKEKEDVEVDLLW